MKTTLEDIPSMRRTNLSPLLYVALIATFLLLALSFRTTASSFPSSFSFQEQPQVSQELSSQQTLLPETPDLMFVGKNSILAATPHLNVTPQVLGAIMGQLDVDIRPEVSRYAVEPGDSLESIAAKFGISLNTVLWANDLSSQAALEPGQELIILPVSGTLHLVRPYDTLSEIAQWYNSKVDEIVEYNVLESPGDLFAGDLLIIPNGIAPKTIPQGRLTPLANSYFIYPIPGPHRITQGLHPFNAVDFSNGVCGESVYGAAGGTVQKTGYSALGGKYARVLHPNGVVTYYGHLSSILVVSGQKVYQGQVIGYTGYTGYTIPQGPAGCHLHFEVRGASNPFR